MRSRRFGALWQERSQALDEVRAWPVFALALPPRLERNPIRGGAPIREAPEVPEEMLRDPLEFVGIPPLEWLCWKLAEDDDAEFQRLYRESDLVDVMKLHARRKAERIADRVRANRELELQIATGG